MINKMTQAQIFETGESPYSVDITVSGHSIKGDESIEAGGHNLGPSPYDILTAALGECTVMTMRWYALQQQWPLEKAIATVTHHKEEKKDIFTKEITLIGESLTDEQRQKLIDVAAKCPVQRTLEGTPSIMTAEIEY